MNHSTVNRRGALAFFGIGMAGAAVARSARAANPEVGSSAPQAGPVGERATENHAPAPALPVGMAAGSYRVAAVGAVVHGAFSVKLSNEAGDSFVVEVCKRDLGVGALGAPARSEHLEVFVANEGDGNAPTREAHGLAAMAFAAALQPHEAHLASAPLLTMRERLDRFGTAVLTDAR